MRQFAYVGEDGQIWVRDLDRDSELQVSRVPNLPASSARTVCNWPTWSPDGENIAYFAYRVANGEAQGTSVWVARADGSQAEPICHMPAGGPIYQCWSPDAQRIAVLVQEGNQLYLRVLDVQQQREPITVAQGAPLYFVWLPDSSGLVANVGAGAPPLGESSLIWISLHAGGAEPTTFARQPAAGFRAPAWSTALGGVTVALGRGDGAELSVHRDPAAGGERLCETAGSPAFVWSPDANKLAFASRPSPEYRAYDGISLYHLTGQRVEKVTSAPTLAFFWLPDSARLLYASMEMDSRLVHLHVVGTSTGLESDLGWFRASRDWLLLLAHFDQYSHAGRVSASTSGELLLASSSAQELGNGSVPTLRQIILRPLGGGEDRVVARGRLAFWRPVPGSHDAG